ncbi:MAG: 4Fe-4S binding protein [Thermoplasmatales archaeon]|nr:MAG: 4Fe-4S binding protein [Thermoplasmatales archaeon]
MKEYEKTGVLSIKNLELPTKRQLEKGVAIVECIQEIPCDPCLTVCPVSAISMKNINDIPKVDFDKCTGCGRCVGICPGLAIFVVKLKEDKALLTLPYEFLPVPKVKDKVIILDRKGEPKGDAVVTRANTSNKTIVITIEIKKDLAMEIRNIKTG